MTRKLYHLDSYRRDVTSVVTGVRTGPGGVAVALEETVFYAVAGGQPADRGELAGRAVLDVIEEDGVIWHMLGDADPPAVGERVRGTIDWERRYDHMQQHTGQHILSQAFLQALDAATVSVHIERSCTIDLSVPSLDAAGAAKAERLANAIVFENRPVIVREVDDAEARSLGLRRPPKQTGLIRVVEVSGFDRSACGGTHVRASGEVGLIVLRGWERYKGGVRVQFLCGWRALADYRQARATLREITAHLSTGDADAADAVARLLARTREVERELETARAALLDREAQDLIATRESLGDRAGPPWLVARALVNRAFGDARGLARALTRGPGVIVILAAEPERRLIVARSADVALDASTVVREAVGRLGGRGGGRPEAAEGAAGDASAEALVDAARAAALRMLGAANQGGVRSP
ncbi:MAG: alanyl-tRNA editing protein [Armatimonadota bacterium]|nr:alanyl-tRNA editing protein [Armatimonadota bacterium]